MIRAKRLQRKDFPEWGGFWKYRQGIWSRAIWHKRRNAHEPALRQSLL